MGTCHYACGCSISTSMFGEGEVMDVSPCSKHLLMLVYPAVANDEISLDVVADMLRQIIFEETPETGTYQGTG